MPIEKNGDIYLGKYAGWYSVRQEAYFDEAETTVGADGIRREPLGSPVEWAEEETYFFRLSAYQDKLLALYANVPDFVLPRERLNEVASFVKGGLKDLSVSRTTFDWGIKVPGAPISCDVCLDGCADELHHGRRLSRCRKRPNSSVTGRPICTSPARISCASTPCTGPHS